MIHQLRNTLSHLPSDRRRRCIVSISSLSSSTRVHRHRQSYTSFSSDVHRKTRASHPPLLTPPLSTLLIRPPAVAPLALLLSTVLAWIRAERAPTLALALLRATLAAVPWAALPVRAHARDHRRRRRCTKAIRDDRRAPASPCRTRCRGGRAVGQLRERRHLPVH